MRRAIHKILFDSLLKCIQNAFYTQTVVESYVYAFQKFEIQLATHTLYTIY